MHLLCFLSLACSLLAAALIPGPREAPATVAAFESGLGFSSEAEPDGGEVKVGARDPVWVGLRIRGSQALDCVWAWLYWVYREPAENSVCIIIYLTFGSKVRDWCTLSWSKVSLLFSTPSGKLLLERKAT